MTLMARETRIKLFQRGGVTGMFGEWLLGFKLYIYDISIS
jgi:hypothetical protein